MDEKEFKLCKRFKTNDSTENEETKIYLIDYFRKKPKMVSPLDDSLNNTKVQYALQNAMAKQTSQRLSRLRSLRKSQRKQAEESGVDALSDEDQANVFVADKI